MARFPAVDVVVGVKNDGQDLHGSSTTNCVTLHSSWIGSSLEEPVFLGHGAHPSFGPVSSDLNSMATFFEFPDYCFFKTGLQNQFSWIGFTGEEGFRKMFGVETGGIYCLLKIHASNKVAQQKYRLPLVLLVASGSSICEVTFPIPKRHAWGEGGSWAFPGASVAGSPSWSQNI